MDVEIAALCDAATDQQGKLNLLGTFDTLTAPGFPVIHPQCSVAYRIRFTRSESGMHRIKVHFVDADGRPVIPPLEGAIEVRFADARATFVTNLVLNIHGLRLEKPGGYSIDLDIDGVQRRSLPLEATTG